MYLDKLVNTDKLDAIAESEILPKKTRRIAFAKATGKRMLEGAILGLAVVGISTYVVWIKSAFTPDPEEE